MMEQFRILTYDKRVAQKIVHKYESQDRKILKDLVAGPCTTVTW